MIAAVPDRIRVDQPTPTVSVQIAVYNGARFLAATLDSLLSQSWTDFELLIVDDGSTDVTPQILADYATRDPRISLLHNPIRRGVSAARNRALAHSCGRYVAISDADDCSYPQRLEKQVAFLDAHPAIGVVSAGVSWIDEAGTPLHKDQRPADDALLRWRLLFCPPVIHTASMIRRQCLQSIAGYDEGKPCAVDYDLWLRLAPYTKFYNPPRGIWLSVRRQPEYLGTTRRRAKSDCHPTYPDSPG
ncbi:MAG: glycosyltransferase family 2 protein [Caldilineaceae bacterium]